MTRDTVFRVASMIKPITSVAALQLVEQEKLALDAPVPDIDPDSAHLKSLTDSMPKGSRSCDQRSGRSRCATCSRIRPVSPTGSGMPRPSGMPVDRAAAEGAKNPRAAHPADVRSRDRWQYGTSIDWVGRIVEAISGEPLDVYFRKHILDPLGMNDTAFVLAAAASARGQCASAGIGRLPCAAAAGAALATPIVLRRRRDLFDRRPTI